MNPKTEIISYKVTHQAWIADDRYKRIQRENALGKLFLDIGRTLQRLGKCEVELSEGSEVSGLDEITIFSAEITPIEGGKK